MLDVEEKEMQIQAPLLISTSRASIMKIAVFHRIFTTSKERDAQGEMPCLQAATSGSLF